jgi:hypothetical protein
MVALTVGVVPVLLMLFTLMMEQVESQLRPRTDTRSLVEATDLDLVQHPPPGGQRRGEHQSQPI